MLRTEPFDQLSMDRVAAEAGVSPPLLFHYFKNKKGFQNAILEAASADLEDRMRPDPELPITSQLRSGIETFVDAVIEHPTIYLAVMRMAGAVATFECARSTEACAALSPRGLSLR